MVILFYGGIKVIETYPFKLKELPYSYEEMEPYIDSKTMYLHHDKHLKTYVDNLNKAIAPYPRLYNWSLEKLLKSLMFLPEDIREKVKNNGGGVYNHNLYFSGLKNNLTKNVPLGKLSKKINEQYINYSNFYKCFKEEALNIFGSGYAWLVMDRNNNLNIIETKNQDTVLDLNLCPILLIDVWEHAYYLKYNNLRDEYIENYSNIINWDKAEERYLACLDKNSCKK